MSVRHRPAVREYRIERTIPNPPLVRDDQGEVSNLSPQDVLPRVEVYGQHEISELTKSREKLTRLLDRFLERDESLPRRKSDLRRELEKNRRSLLDTQAELRQIEERLAALPGLEETLEQFRKAGLEERLREQSLVVREERVLASIPERLAPFRECLENLKRETPIDRAFLSAKALEDLPGKEILSRANAVFERLDRDVERIATELEQAMHRADEGIAAVRAEWEARKRQVQAAYEKILRELQKSRVDGEEFIRLRRQIEELRPLRERQNAGAPRGEGAHRPAPGAPCGVGGFQGRASFGASIALQRRSTRSCTTKSRSRSLPLATASLCSRCCVMRSAAACPRQSTRSPASEALSLTQFVEACRAGTNALNKAFGITPAQAERLAKAEPEVLMRIEELDLPPTTAIRLNTAPAGDPPAWQTLEDLSTGQKATAVLLLLLLESDAPLIVDQPEDDLDNRFITEGVVPRMREEKQRRQFVFSTHNANIPVLGDAELIVGLSASGEAEHGRARIAPEHMGSIDSQPVRELVEEILEGGKEAFERRRRKYGF